MPARPVGSLRLLGSGRGVRFSPISTKLRAVRALALARCGAEVDATAGRAGENLQLHHALAELRPFPEYQLPPAGRAPGPEFPNAHRLHLLAAPDALGYSSLVRRLSFAHRHHLGTAKYLSGT